MKAKKDEELLEKQKREEKKIALRKLEQIVDNLIVGLSDESKPSALDTEDINKAISNISKVGRNMFPFLKERVSTSTLYLICIDIRNFYNLTCRKNWQRIFFEIKKKTSSV